MVSKKFWSQSQLPVLTLVKVLNLLIMTFEVLPPFPGSFVAIALIDLRSERLLIFLAVVSFSLCLLVATEATIAFFILVMNGILTDVIVVKCLVGKMIEMGLS